MCRERVTPCHIGGEAAAGPKESSMNASLLWIIAVVIAIIGLVQLLQGQVILGVVLLVAAALVGPGGHSMFRARS